MPLDLDTQRREGLICGYCDKKPELQTGAEVYGKHRPDLADLKFWVCVACDARVGCYPYNTNALGRLANANLRGLRMAVHGELDKRWKQGDETRDATYKWLREGMNIPAAHCHIGMFDEQQCNDALGLCLGMEIGLPEVADREMPF